MAPRVERRLAAILAADVVGYSRLMQADEAGTHARFKALRKELIEPRVADHAGRIVKLTGDGALVEFASVVEAVLAAAEIQRAVIEHQASVPEAERIAFRIGINLGDVIFDEDDIYGDGVNVANRLEGQAEPGGICVARTVYNLVRNKLDLAFEPMGAHRVKNIAEPVEIWRVLLEGGAAKRPPLPLFDKPSIAVLPIENLSGDPKRESLADGITEDIITDLSRFRDLIVIARNSTYAYKHKATDVRQIGRELGVHYVLEGSLQTDGKHLRVSAQLVDAATGKHVWSERYDRPLDDIFAVQGEVTQTIAASLAGDSGVVARAWLEVARRKPPANLQAYGFYLLGLEQTDLMVEEANKKSEEFFRKALDLDPNFARAYVGLAWSYNHAHDNGWGASRRESLAKWLEASKRAIALDPRDGEAHMTLGWYHQYTGHRERARTEIDLAVSLNPNNADVLVQASAVLPWLGAPEQAIEAAERAIRLNPFFPHWYYGPMRDAYFHARHFEKAIRASEQRQNATLWDLVYRPLCYAQIGRVNEATAAVAELLQRDCEYSAEGFLSANGTYAREIELNLFLESHRKAGMRICATEAQLAKNPDMKRLPVCNAERAKS